MANPARATEIAAIRDAARTIRTPAMNRSGAKMTAPTPVEIVNIPVAVAGVYELTDAEVKRARSRIYGLNKENTFGWRWRTVREHPFLLVWRIN